MRVLVVVLLVGIAGCGGGSSPPGDDSDTGGAETGPKPVGTEPKVIYPDLTPRQVRTGKAVRLPVEIRRHKSGDFEITTADKVIGAAVVATGFGLGALIGKKVFDYFNTEEESEPLKIATLTYPSVIHAGRIITSKQLFDRFASQWKKQFDIQLVKIPVSWFPESEIGRDYVKALSRIDISFDFESDNSQQVQIVNRFPDTSFKETGFKVDGHVGVGVEGFQKLGPAQLKADANIGIHFQYTPLVAEVISEGVGTHARWQLTAVNNVFPVGQKDYYCTVLVPRSLKSTTAKLTVVLFIDEQNDVKMTFGPYEIEIEFGD